MIDIAVKERTNPQDEMLMLTNIVTWLLHELKNLYTTGQITTCMYPSGYILVYDEDLKRSDILLFCEGENQKKMLEILQQPPESYKEKYIACVPSKEPDSVQEQSAMEVEEEEERHSHRKIAHVNGMEDLDENT